MRALRVLCAVVLAAGICLTTRAAWLHAKAALAGVLIRQAWEQGAVTDEPRSPWPWADTHPVARLHIPRLHYDEIVLEGATQRTMAFGPARLLNGAAPGRPGNLVLAGHRTSWFRPLEDITLGDSIQIQWFDQRRGGLFERDYKVAMIRVVQPEDTGLLAPTPEDALTLITCYPFGRGPNSPQRFVVRAMPDGPSRILRRVDLRGHGQATAEGYQQLPRRPRYASLPFAG